MTYAIAAAGTGGHINPALAVAEALVRRGVDRESVLFVGGDRLEAEAVPDAGFPFVGFELTKLHRSLSPQNFKIPSVLRRTSAAMAAEFRRHGAKVVLGMSGYVTVPAAMGARRAGLPFVLQEQNARPGIAARFASKRAAKTFLGLPGRAERLPRSEVVGNPLHPEISEFKRKDLKLEAGRRYGVEGAKPILGVLGGSQGARVLNQAVPRIAAAGAMGAIVHLTGKSAVAEMQQRSAGSSLPWIRIPYESQMEYFYAAADLVVCRAGAMTVSELAATGTPSILVPLARVGQEWNALALAESGGAEIVSEGDVGSLPARINALIADERGLASMSRAARSQGRPHAAGAIAEHLMEMSGA